MALGSAFFDETDFRARNCAASRELTQYAGRVFQFCKPKAYLGGLAMSRLFIRFISLVHGILAASAWAGVTAAAGAVRACIPASYRHFAPFLRTARVLLVVFGFGFGSLAFAQTASFSYAIVTLGGGFSSPNGVAVDGSGNVYAADWSNSAVKKMPAGCASSNCVTTLGGGFSYPTGVAVDGSGNVYVADRLNNAVKEMPAGCVSSSCVTALGGGFNHPTGVAVDRSGTSMSPILTTLR
jgi:hypothetical protein